MRCLNANNHVYIFSKKGCCGGVSTKVNHLILLLRSYFNIVCIPDYTISLSNRGLAFDDGLSALRSRNCKVGLFFSDENYIKRGVMQYAKLRGLSVVWSNEMMWHTEAELEAVREGLIDKVLYVSEFQKKALERGYGDIPWAMTGNYIAPSYFPFTERRNAHFTIGRLSRAAQEKYPEDFPVFYECLGLPDARFRVMAWDDSLAYKYRWYNFDSRWDLLHAEQETQVQFLHSLDLFVYPLGHRFKESWGRSTVEAMLTGCIPLVPTGHQFENLIIHGETGYICQDFADYRQYAQELFWNTSLRKLMARQCHEHAVQKLCNREEHLKVWLNALQ